MVKAMPQAAKAWVVKYEAMRGVLNNVVPDHHQKHGNEGEPETDVGLTDKRKTGSLAKPHGRQQDEGLVEQYTGKKIPVGPPLAAARLEALHYSDAIACCERRPDSVEHHHVPCPHQNGKR